MRKRYIVALAALAAAFAVFGAAPAGANAPGLTASDLGKKIANFNIILHPNSWDQSDTTCQNNGSRIFFSADVTPWLLTWNFLTSANGFDITDCNGTNDGNASIAQNVGAQVAVFIRLQGPNNDNNSLMLTCTQLVFTANNTQECLIAAPVNLGKSKTFVRISQHLFDTVNSSFLWTMIPGTDFKIAQVDVYELLT